MNEQVLTKRISGHSRIDGEACNCGISSCRQLFTCTDRQGKLGTPHRLPSKRLSGLARLVRESVLRALAQALTSALQVPVPERAQASGASKLVGERFVPWACLCKPHSHVLAGSSWLRCWPRNLAATKPKACTSSRSRLHQVCASTLIVDLFGTVSMLLSGRFHSLVPFWRELRCNSKIALRSTVLYSTVCFRSQTASRDWRGLIDIAASVLPQLPRGNSLDCVFDGVFEHMSLQGLRKRSMSPEERDRNRQRKRPRRDQGECTGGPQERERLPAGFALHSIAVALRAEESDRHPSRDRRSERARLLQTYSCRERLACVSFHAFLTRDLRCALK